MAPVQPAGRMPVLVFRPQRRFLAGTGSAAGYDGAALARRGMVVVTLNYGLGATGCKIDDAPANRRLLDVVGALLSDPLAEGLFHEATAQSGNGIGAFTPMRASRVTRALAREAAMPPTVDGFAGGSTA